MELKLVRQGKKLGVGRKMNNEQEAEIFKLICSKRPWQVGFKTSFHNVRLSLWNRELVRQLIEKKYLLLNEFKLSLSDEGVANQLKRWGFSSVNMRKRGYAGCHRVIQNWLDVHYPAIKDRVKSEDGKILWMRKMAIGADELSEGKMLPKLSMIAVITNQSKVHWLVNKGHFVPARQIKFLNALISEFSEKIFLIREDYKTLESQEVANWLNKNNRIEVFPPLELKHKDNRLVETYGQKQNNSASGGE